MYKIELDYNKSKSNMTNLPVGFALRGHGADVMVRSGAMRGIVSKEPSPRNADDTNKLFLINALLRKLRLGVHHLRSDHFSAVTILVRTLGKLFAQDGQSDKPIVSDQKN